MKSIKEISIILDVSTTTVYNHINKLDDKIKPYMFNVKGATYLDEEGIRQLKISMGLLQIPTVREDISMNNIIDEISASVTGKLENRMGKDYEALEKKIKTDYKNLEEQVKGLKDQNERLIYLLEEKHNKTFLERLKEIFKKN